MATELMTAHDIAALAGVQRPVVTMWRRRHRTGPQAFPLPVTSAGVVPLFARAPVLTWLEATGRLTDDFDRDDLPRFQTFGVATQLNASEAHAVSAALALAALSGADLRDLDAVDAVDLAEEIDEADTFLFREIEAVTDWSLVARVATELADAWYSPSQAIEGLLAQVDRWEPSWRSAMLAPPLQTFAAKLAVELSRELDDSTMLITDATAGLGDLAFAAVTGPGRDLIHEICLSDADTPAARFARRRVNALKVPVRVAKCHRDDDGYLLPKAGVAFAAFPSVGFAALTDEELINEVTELDLALTDNARAIVIGPASALCEEALGTARGDLIRRGRLRAAVRLPKGLLPSRPHQQLGLWVLGRVASQERVRHDKVAVGFHDAETALDGPMTQALIDDILAASLDQVVAPRDLIVLTRVATRLLASGTIPVAPRDSMALPGTRGERRDRALADAVSTLREGVPGVSLEVHGSVQSTERATQQVQELLATRRLRLIKGTTAEVTNVPDGDVPAVSVSVDGLNWAGACTTRVALEAVDLADRITSPGDVVFTVRPRPLAVVDRAGGHLLCSPARVLRIADGDPELLPDVVAQAICDQPNSATSWRRWRIPLLPHHAMEPARDALNELATVETQARHLLTLITELRRHALGPENLLSTMRKDIPADAT